MNANARLRYALLAALLVGLKLALHPLLAYGLRRYLFDYRVDLETPLWLLIDAQSRVRKVYAQAPREAVVTAADCQRVIEAGAEYVVSPILRPEIAATARAAERISVIGAYTPTEAQNAHEAGADFIKIFPADTLGPDYIKALRQCISAAHYLINSAIRPSVALSISSTTSWNASIPEPQGSGTTNSCASLDVGSIPRRAGSNWRSKNTFAFSSALFAAVKTNARLDRSIHKIKSCSRNDAGLNCFASW